MTDVRCECLFPRHHAGPRYRESGRLAARGPVPALAVCFVILLATAPAVSLEADAETPSVQIRALIHDGHYEEASKASREYVAAVVAAEGAESLAHARALDLLVESLQRAGHAAQDETLALARQSVAIKEKQLPPDDPDLAVTLRILATVVQDRSDLKEAQSLYERVLEIHRKKYGSDHVEVAGSLVDLANLLSTRAEYRLAQSYYEQALAVQEKLLGPKDLEVATTLNNLGIVLRRTGDYPRARERYERAIAIREEVQGPDHIDLAFPLNGLALLMDQTGDQREARRLYDRSLAIREKTLGPDHVQVATSLNNIAFLLEKTGYYAEARPLYERALGINRKSYGEKHRATAMSLNNLGRQLYLMGDRGEAKDLYERALAIRREVLGVRHPETAASLESLARLWVEAGDIAKGRSLYEEARGIWEEQVGTEHPNTARNYAELAALLEKQGDRSAARSLAQRALEIQKKVLGKEHTDIANSMVLLARFDLHDRNLTAAESHAREALAIRKTTFGEDHPLVAESLRQTAEIDLAAGDRAAALEAALEAETVARRHLVLTAATLAEREALDYSRTRASGLDLALSMLGPSPSSSDAKQVFDAVVRTRALVLDEMASRRRAASEASPELRRLLDRLTATRGRFASLSLAGPAQQSMEAYAAILNEARSDVETAERDAARATTSRRASGVSRATLEDLSAALPARSALVAYVRFDRYAGPNEEARRAPAGNYRAFVLKSGFALRTIDFGSAGAIDDLIGRWNRNVVGAGAVGDDLISAGSALRARIWDPLAPLFGSVDRVFIVPDGQVNAISMAALPGAGGGYLVEAGPTFHYLSAERDLMTVSSHEAPSSLLAIGGPDFGAAAAGTVADAAIAGTPAPRGEQSGCPDLASLRFGPLPAARQEAETVASLWKQMGSGAGVATVLEGTEATEAAFKTQAAKFDVLHLATHGFFLDSTCAAVSGAESRGIGGAAPAGEGNPSRAGIVTSPLLLAGLALGGANARLSGEGEDGILTAEEILSLDLSGVSCVVLSACDTGRGRIIHGEGLLGLRRAFEIAGAGALIMSLWPADDQSTLEWMRALYEGWVLSSLSPAEAVQEASLRTLKQRRTRGEDTNPFYWGGFVVFGN